MAESYATFTPKAPQYSFYLPLPYTSGEAYVTGSFLYSGNLKHRQALSSCFLTNLTAHFIGHPPVRGRKYHSEGDHEVITNLLSAIHTLGPGLVQ